MSDRSLSRASWVAFAAFTGALYLISSCARDSATVEQSDSVPEATSTQAPSDTGVTDDPSTADDAAIAEAAVAALPPEGTPESLGEWSQLDARDGELVMLDGVTPYGLNSALFTDYAHKLRTVWMPDGAAAAMSDPDATFDFPVGTVITKTFYYPEPDGTAEVLLTESDDSALAAPLQLADVRLIETRVLVHRDDGWHAFPYVWDDEESEATLQRTGDVVPLAAMSDDGTETPLTYVVPDVNQCASCHAVNHTTGAIEPIGPKARHLNRAVDYGDGPESQLDHWQNSGLLAVRRRRPRCPAQWSGTTRRHRSKTGRGPTSTSTVRTATARSGLPTPRGCSSTSTPRSDPSTASASRRSLPAVARVGASSTSHRANPTSRSSPTAWSRPNLRR